MESISKTKVSAALKLNQKKIKRSLKKNKQQIKLEKTVPEHQNNSNGQKKKKLKVKNFSFQTDEEDDKAIPPVILPDSSEDCFKWLIDPVPMAQFFKDVWGKKPLLVNRGSSEYYQNLFSCNEMQEILKKNLVLFGKHVDVTSYKNGVRETHTPVGRAYPAVVWDFFQNDCSIRMLSPQTHSENLWKVNTMLQSFFGNFVGANVYLTPKGTQGFAPHYDDIEAFVLQLEGKKEWKVYLPRPTERLPRYSSRNFSDKEIGQPILTVILEPGDLLYMPRGFIHQAKSDPEVHSLHVTLSTYQKTTWGDLLEKIVPQALNTAINENIEFRKALPIGYLNYMGVAHTGMDFGNRQEFNEKVHSLFEKLFDYLPIDAASDQMGKAFLNQALPHKLDSREKLCSIHGNGDHWENGNVINRKEIELKTNLRLINPQAVRLVMEEEEVRLYHSFENTRQYQEVEPQYFEIGAEMASAVEYLIHSWPLYKRVNDLPVSDNKNKLEIACLLYDKGLLVTQEALQPVALQPEDKK